MVTIYSREGMVRCMVNKNVERSTPIVARLKGKSSERGNTP
jgi:hypothetical protein